ncbi:MAG: serine hydrolase domain-containing protein [Pseudomonadota bacterium]
MSPNTLYRCQYRALVFALLLASAVHAQQTSQPFETALQDESGRQRWTLVERMDHYGVPGMSMALVRNFEISFTGTYGDRIKGKEPVDTDTVFSVGSLSKTAAAMTALSLVSQGALDLDTDVNQYLTSWQIPGSRSANGKPVTLRRLLSHTSGTSVWGFGDFQPDEKLPSVLEILDGKDPAKNEPIRVVYEPGTDFRYSGGGITVAQLVTADVTGIDFEPLAERLVFSALGMSRSTFANPLPAAVGNIAHAYDSEGEPAALPRGWHGFAETGASGLWTTPTDYATMMLALIDSYRGGANSFLSQSVAQEALTSVPPSPHGLGPGVYGSGVDMIIRHSGANESYKAWYEFYPNRGEGVVIFTNGARGKELYSEILPAIRQQMNWPEQKK